RAALRGRAVRRRARPAPARRAERRRGARRLLPQRRARPEAPRERAGARGRPRLVPGRRSLRGGDRVRARRGTDRPPGGMRGLIPLALVAAGCQLHPQLALPVRADFQRGVALGLFAHAEDVDYEEQLRELAGLGASDVALVITWVQDDV